ncbi:MAG: HAD-IA family hydrolase [Deltaproteobacteria bacterium]|nr:HAD-IA family hydrolase [Deltaproteobacteria bacterium]MBW2050082.1 HAD-IA family hydrolase [Deltaproteobacteria bacterium]MBW2112264.1 HAD-IA family hydrolase [Deltaproteobacteria bacterium]HDZ89916.1 HAD family hydrolase [Deltaproteobacteria bacterium]
MNGKKRISAVIFDCDGVMFDSRQANINFYNHLLEHFGRPPMNRDAVDFVHMNTAESSVRHIFQGTPFTDEAQNYRMVVDYSPFIKDMVITPGLKRLLVKLRPVAGLAVATNRSNTIGEVLEQNGLSGFFDIVVSSLDVKHPKPHPESIHKILAFFHIGPEQAVYIGDSLIDLETARSAGVRFIAYGNEKLDSHVRATTMEDVERILAQMGMEEDYSR